MTKAAREVANWQRYYDMTDASLPDDERRRRAVALRDAHIARMTLASLRARRVNDDRLRLVEARIEAIEQAIADAAL